MGSLLRGLGVGAGLMYFFDPRSGNRRRAVLRDKTIHAINVTEDFFDRAVRDLNNRVQGVKADAASMFSREPCPDEVLAERVRSKLGRYTSHPGALDVECRNGHVVLRGPILAHELDHVLSAACGVRGVRDVENQLEPHEHAGNISSLQGGIARPGECSDLMQENWSPATRLLAGAVGGALLLNGIVKRGLGSKLLGLAGLGLFMRGTTNMDTRRLLGIGGGRRGFDIQKTVHIHAPVDQVFGFVTDFERSSRFFPHVRSIRDLGNGRLRWTLHGPGNAHIELEEVLTRVEPNRVIAWESTTDSPVAYQGTVHFEPQPDDTTRVHIQMSYLPPGGAAGHLFAQVFGVDPKHQLEESLMRIKTFLETGHMPHDAARREEASIEQQQPSEPPQAERQPVEQQFSP